MIVRVGRMTPHLMDKCGEHFPGKDSGGKLTVDKFARICERVGVAMNVMHLKELYTKATEQGGELTYEEFKVSLFPDGEEEYQEFSQSAWRYPRRSQGDDVTETETETIATSVADRVEETEVETEVIEPTCQDELDLSDVSVSDMVIACREYFSAKKSKDFVFSTPFSRYLNGDGKFDLLEFQWMCECIGLTLDEKQLSSLDGKAEQNGDGKISITDFMETFPKIEKKVAKPKRKKKQRTARKSKVLMSVEQVKAELIRKCREFFQAMDINENDCLNQDEFINLCKHVATDFNAEQLTKLHATVDETCDGKISFRAFLFVGEKDAAEVRKSRLFTTDVLGQVANLDSITEITQGTTMRSPDQQMKIYREYFRELDVNGDGKLSKEEFLRMSQHIGLNLNSEQLKRVYAKADETGDGLISFREFLSAFSGENDNCQPRGRQNLAPSQIAVVDDNKRSSDQTKIYREYFRELDVNGDGILSKEEFYKMSQAIGLQLDGEQLKKVYMKADETGDGNITFREFLAAFSGEKQKPQKKHSMVVHRNAPQIDNKRGSDQTDNKRGSDQMKVYREYFRELDVNGDGKLSKEEFLKMSQTIGLNLDSEQLKRVYAKADETGDGFVTFREFMFAFNGESRGRRASIHPASTGQDRTHRSSMRMSNKDNQHQNSGRKVSVTFHDAEKDQDVTKRRSNDLSRGSDQMKIYREYFAAMDINGDGKLSQAEFLHMSKKIGLNLEPEQLKRVYAKADETGDGEVTFREFLAAFGGDSSKVKCCTSMNSKKCIPGSCSENTELQDIAEEDGRIHSACKYFWNSDLDCDGRLDSAEFSRMLDALGMKLSRRDVTKAFKVADSDGEGYVNFTNFVDVYLSATRVGSLLSREKIKQIFRQIDVEGKMFLDSDQFTKALQRLGKVGDALAVKRLMGYAAASDRNRVYFPEFCTFFGVK